MKYGFSLIHSGVVEANDLKEAQEKAYEKAIEDLKQRYCGVLVVNPEMLSVGNEMI